MTTWTATPQQIMRFSVFEAPLSLNAVSTQFKLTFKGALNINLTHLLYVVMLPPPNFFCRVKIFPIKTIYHPTMKKRD